MKSLEALFPKVPEPARNLGVLGLLPFAVGALMCLLGGARLDARGVSWLLVYGAIILAFLGGIRWGQLMVKGEAEISSAMTLSVAGSVLGFVAVVLLGGKWGLLLLLMGYLAHYVYDRRAVRHDELPRWYGRLRLMLSTAVVLCLLVGLVFG